MAQKTEEHTIHDQAYPLKVQSMFLKNSLQLEAKKTSKTSRLHRDNMLILVVTDVFEDLK